MESQFGGDPEKEALLSASSTSSSCLPTHISHSPSTKQQAKSTSGSCETNPAVRSRNIRCDGLFCFLLLFLVGTCFGLALFPLLVTMMSFQYMSEMPSRQATSRPDAPSMNTTSSSLPGPIVFTPVRFSEIAGMDEAKNELTEVVRFLQTPANFTRLGARMPKGVLLVGPPGSGKTMMARAVATEANVPYLYTSGSEFIEIYVGQGAKRIRELFSYARSKAPCILFLDELDAVGGKRQSGMGSGGQREHDQTLNQLLVELDGFNSTSGIVVLGATNRIDVLDSALLRPGRFDRIVHVPLPDMAGRELIITSYLNKVKYDRADVDIKAVARVTPGFSGAELENMINEAAILTARTGKSLIGKDEVMEARDKVTMGPALRSIVMSESQRRLTAYHEAGHALVAYYLSPHADPIHKATIVTRGSALGFVEQMPPDNRYGHERRQLEARLAVAMGGRTAEELVFGKGAVSNGASSDISMATALAYKMVSEWGMSDKLGPLNYNRGLLGNMYGARGSAGMEGGRLSDESAGLVEKEVKRLVSDAQATAERILRKHRKELDVIALALLEKETLTGKEITELINPKSKKS
eukprot:GHVQ01011555.1.p1 GENE.GHVQ01011555.1~~GHVQ01011555.1.p1  ORF type:complete len:583 (-),score=79.50 GHVQ01011555.1:6806-8554(-)